MKILITGASGLIGRSTVRSLKLSGNTVLSLSRTPKKDAFKWDPNLGEIELPHDANIDAVIHLAGENISRVRWSRKQKESILESRIKGTQLLVDTITRLPSPPKILLAASGIGIFGNSHDVLLSEDDNPGVGFLADVAREWERATKLAVDSGIRVSNLRMGVVMSGEGGLLKRLLPIFSYGFGAVLGSGEQYMSWIIIDDVVRAIECILTNEDINGPVNMVAPNPISNRECM